MYGGPSTTLGGGALGGILAATGADPILPLVIAGVCLVAGLLLLVRERILTRRARTA
ncbi:hypothetical protein [Microbacterium sp. NPDC089695]|uniref:hypothetical protein n=1 Tax=Microbacterium sp. NPDC089695 TaxID=3364198 RepID=UPI00382264A0